MRVNRMVKRVKKKVKNRMSKRVNQWLLMRANMMMSRVVVERESE